MVGKKTFQILHVTTWQNIQPVYFCSHYFLLWVTCVCPGPFPVTNYGWHRLESNWGRRSVARTVGGRSVVSKIKFVTHKQLSCDPTVHCALLLIDSGCLVTWWWIVSSPDARHQSPIMSNYHSDGDNSKWLPFILSVWVKCCQLSL